MMIQQNTSNHDNKTLSAYFETVFIGAMMCKPTQYRIDARRAVQLIGKFFPGIRVSKIDLSVLDEFQCHMMNEGYIEKTAARYRFRIAAVVRHWNPAVFPQRKTSRDVDRDDQTLLWTVFSERFAPAKLATRTEQTRKHYRLSLENNGRILGPPGSAGGPNRSKRRRHAGLAG